MKFSSSLFASSLLMLFPSSSAEVPFPLSVFGGEVTLGSKQVDVTGVVEDTVITLASIGGAAALKCGDDTFSGSLGIDIKPDLLGIVQVGASLASDSGATIELKYVVKELGLGTLIGLTDTFKNPIEFDIDLTNCESPMLTLALDGTCEESGLGAVFDVFAGSTVTPGSSIGKLEITTIPANTCGGALNVVADSAVGINGADPLNDLFLSYTFDLSPCVNLEGLKIVADTDLVSGCPHTDSDPHFLTFGGQHYDFQGACDLVLVDNAGYKDGKGLHIHGRTKVFGSTFSSLASVAVMIGDDIIEVHGEDLALINGVEYPVPAIEGSEFNFPMTIGDYALTVQILGPHSRRHIIHMGNGERILINNFKEFVDVYLDSAKPEDFALTTGMWGTYGAHGAMMARDGKTVIEDGDSMGDEWQVRPFDAQLFNIIDGPQYPTKCKMPEAATAEQRHLRAMAKKVSEDDAKKACANAAASRKDNCIADVFGSDNLEMAQIYTMGSL